MKTFKFASKSSGEEHTTTLHDDGRLTCTCRGYRTPSKCWHVKEVAEKEGLDIVIGGIIFGHTVEPARTTPRTLLDFTRPNEEKVVFESTANHFILPMLASALPEGQTIDHYAKPGWLLDEKVDGHRMIVHVSDQHTVMAYARSGIPRVLPAHIWNALTVVAPGTYDGELYMPGGTSTDVTALKLQHKLKLVFFDMLKVGDESCMDRAASYRRELLEVACSKLKGDDVTVIRQFPVSQTALQAIWNQGGEGAVLKKIDATYQPGKRSPAWIKFKKQLAAIITITGFKKGLLGPHSVVCGIDESGIEVQCKTLNDEWRARFLREGGEGYVGRRLVISYQQKTVDGRYRHPMFDHLLEEVR